MANRGMDPDPDRRVSCNGSLQSRVTEYSLRLINDYFPGFSSSRLGASFWGRSFRTRGRAQGRGKGLYVVRAEGHWAGQGLSACQAGFFLLPRPCRFCAQGTGRTNEGGHAKWKVLDSGRFGTLWQGNGRWSGSDAALIYADAGRRGKSSSSSWTCRAGRTRAGKRFAAGELSQRRRLLGLVLAAGIHTLRAGADQRAPRLPECPDKPLGGRTRSLI